jgi:hypothetical protein
MDCHLEMICAKCEFVNRATQLGISMTNDICKKMSTKEFFFAVKEYPQELKVKTHIMAT